MGAEEKESTVKKCIEQMLMIAAESRENLNVQDTRKHILFLASEYSYIWCGVMPLFKYYAKKKYTLCTVVFPDIKHILEISERNLNEIADNSLEIRHQGGVVWFDDTWQPCSSYEVCYLNLGLSRWYSFGISENIRKVSKKIISLQAIAYHTHYYHGSEKFDGMFAESHRKCIDYAVVSCFIAAWASQKEENWKDKLVPLGYPRMDSLYKNLKECKIPEQWKKKAEGKKVIYFNGTLQSSLFIYCYEYCKKNQAEILWRPHPYDFEKPHVRERVEKLKQDKNIIIDTNQSYDAAFCISDAMVTVYYSSILINYLFTDKPVLILDKGFYHEDNKIDFSDEAWYKASYVTNDEESGRAFIDMIMDGRDDEKEDKLPYRKFMQQGFDGMVCERIADFADKNFSDI